MLADYIEHKLYTSIEEVHEKIAVYFALNKLTEGEFLTLFNLLYPMIGSVENELEIMTLEMNQSKTQGLIHPLPSQAKEVIEKLCQVNKMTDMSHKLQMFVETGQLTEQERLIMISPDEGIMILPIVGEETDIEATVQE